SARRPHCRPRAPAADEDSPSLLAASRLALPSSAADSPPPPFRPRRGLAARASAALALFRLALPLPPFGGLCFLPAGPGGKGGASSKSHAAQRVGRGVTRVQTGQAKVSAPNRSHEPYSDGGQVGRAVPGGGEDAAENVGGVGPRPSDSESAGYRLPPLSCGAWVLSISISSSSRDQPSSLSPPPSPGSEDDVDPGRPPDYMVLAAALLTTWSHQPPGLAANPSRFHRSCISSSPSHFTLAALKALEGPPEEAFRLGLRQGRRRGQEGSPAGAGGAALPRRRVLGSVGLRWVLCKGPGGQIFDIPTYRYCALERTIGAYCAFERTIGLSMKLTLLWLIPGRDIAADLSLGLLRRIGVAGLVGIGATVAE
ncbi:hypothetical protein THAOC_17630, partial [Thalassiosira oceanica]